jgi:hypothetical protein
MELLDSQIIETNQPFQIASGEEAERTRERAMMNFVCAMARYQASVDHERELAARGTGDGQTRH